MPLMRHITTDFGSPAWLGDGVNALSPQSLIVKSSDFDAVVAKYNGIPSGYPVKLEKGKVLPAAAGDSPDGFVLFPQGTVVGDFQVAVVVQGIIRLNRLPKLADDSAIAKPADSKSFVYIEDGEGA